MERFLTVFRGIVAVVFLLLLLALGVALVCGKANLLPGSQSRDARYAKRLSRLIGIALLFGLVSIPLVLFFYGKGLVWASSGIILLTFALSGSACVYAMRGVRK